MSARPAESYPFSAIVGQDTLKTALLINAVDPKVGGVLIRGQKGTAKSTAVRALTAVLPEIEVVSGCRFSCEPTASRLCPECAKRVHLSSAKRTPHVVDLPVSATEDRLVGTLDLEHALKHGEKRFEPGLLARAHRAILYVDEVNLLEDHLVDSLLDAAAMGVNVVEREGIAFSHASRFILVGTMNPEEGDLRPQLLDRFALCVDVEGLSDPAERVEIVKRRAAYEEDPVRFCREWKAHDEGLRRAVSRAQSRLGGVGTDDDVLLLVAQIATRVGVDGHRADIVMSRAARALAALESRDTVTPMDVSRVAPLVLAHRTRRNPLDEHTLDTQRIREITTSACASGAGTQERDPAPSGDPGPGADAVTLVSAKVFETAAEPPVQQVRMSVPLDDVRRSSSGRRQTTRSEDRRGRYVRSEAPRGTERGDVALDATLRAAAAQQNSREGDLAINLRSSDIRTKVRKRKVGASILFCVDASGSMSASTRMEATKAAVMELLMEAYQRRDRVGLVSFRGDDAELLLAPTASVDLAKLKLRALPTGGATPLAHGMLKSLEVLSKETRRDDTVVPWLVLVTDGRANVGINGGLGSDDAREAATRVREAKVNTVVIDTNSSSAASAPARELARLAGGEYVRLSTLDGDSVAGAVRERLEAV